MTEMEEIKKLVASRTLLNTTLQTSKALSTELHKSGPKIAKIKQRLPPLQATRISSFEGVRYQINGVIGSATSILKLFSVVQELENLLFSIPFSDLFKFLSVLRQIEEAMRFLGEQGKLTMHWLEGVFQDLEGNPVIDNLDVKKALRVLHSLQEIDVCARLKGGVLFEAFEKLECEFKRLLVQVTVPISLIGSSAEKIDCFIPDDVVEKLQAIVQRLKSTNRHESCLSTYIEVRSLNIKTSLQALDLTYLENSITEFVEVQDIEVEIDTWCMHFELVVKNLFAAEYELCSDVFENVGSDISSRCFAKIAMESGILHLLEFGKKVTECKKDPVKLLKLLDIFAVLDALRVDFNHLFGGKSCSEIQNQTRDLISRVVNGACEIFWELPVQVKLQRRIPPPGNGNVPRLVTFVTGYCDQLLGDKYRPIMTQVLMIHKSWKQEKTEEGLLAKQVYNVIKEIALNLDAWSSAYQDITLSYLFMMNNHSHFSDLKGTKLGEMMGGSWLRAHEQYKDYYAALYIKNSWGKLLVLLNMKSSGLTLTIDEKPGARDRIKKGLKAFNEAIDCLWKKQCDWIVCDASLKEKIVKLVVQAIVPAYRNYLSSYVLLTEEDFSARKHVKYSVQSLENMLSCLFEPKLRKFGSSRQFQFIGRIKDVVTNQFHLMLTAT